MAVAPFVVTPELTSVAIRYTNRQLIADQVLPRVPVALQIFKYMKFSLAEGFTLPDTRVGRRGQPNEVEFTGTETDASCEDYGLDDPVPQSDILNAPPGYDPVGRATEGVTDLVMLDREVRTAGLVFALNTYPAAQRTTLSGTSQWSDFTNSDPLGAILGALDTMVMRANIAVMGQATWTKVRTHPNIVKAVYGYANDKGAATREQVAALLELDEIIVGQGWVNSAKKGQATTMGRVWGKHCALLHRNGMADTSGRRTTFGFTAQWGTRVAGTMPDGKIGLRGGTRVRVGESVKEVVAASDLGYFFQNAVA